METDKHVPAVETTSDVYDWVYCPGCKETRMHPKGCSANCTRRSCESRFMHRTNVLHAHLLRHAARPRHEDY